MQEDNNVILQYPTLCGEISQKEMNNLYEFYAGRFSEMTSITTYLYQSIITSGMEISYLLKELAICEMSHLEALAKAILYYGGDPLFAGKYNYYSCSYVNYCKDVREFLQTDIEWEVNAYKEYKECALKSNNASFSQLMTRFSLDEELHVSRLRSAYFKLFNEEV